LSNKVVDHNDVVLVVFYPVSSIVCFVLVVLKWNNAISRFHLSIDEFVVCIIQVSWYGNMDSTHNSRNICHVCKHDNVH